MSRLVVGDCMLYRVPTRTGKTFTSQGKVREFCADWKSQGNLDKILEKAGKFLFFVVIFNWTVFVKMDQVFRPTWWVSWVVIQFGESWYPAACTCSTSTDSILGLLLTSYTIWVGWPWEDHTKVEGAHKALIYIP